MIADETTDGPAAGRVAPRASPCTRGGTFLLSLAVLIGLASNIDADEVKTPTEQIIRDAENRASSGWSMPRGRMRLLRSSSYRAYERVNERLWERHGLLYVIAPTVMAQAGTQGGPHDFTANEQVATTIGWEVLRRSRIGDGGFVLNHLHVGQITDTTGIDFTGSLGTNFLPSDSVVDLDIFKALGWRHSIHDDKIVLLLGQTLAAEVDGGGRFTADDTSGFISQPLSNNPARQMPGAGWGFGFDVSPSKHWTFQAHVQDALGDGSLKSPDEFFKSGKALVAAGVELNDPFRRSGTGWYKVSGYWVPATKQGTPDAQAEGWGLHFQAEQDVGRFAVFAKYGFSKGRLGLVDRYGNAGVVWRCPFGCSDDRMGLGFGAVHPTAASTNTEYVAEAYWKVQLTPFIQLTPDLQCIFQPSYRPQTDVELVGTLRLRMQF